MPEFKFDPRQHEAHVREAMERQAKYDAFDKLVDMALDSQITMGEAIAEFRADYVETDDAGH